jgi:hypothetical protein
MGWLFGCDQHLDLGYTGQLSQHGGRCHAQVVEPALHLRQVRLDRLLAAAALLLDLRLQHLDTVGGRRRRGLLLRGAASDGDQEQDGPETHRHPLLNVGFDSVYSVGRKRFAVKRRHHS